MNDENIAKQCPTCKEWRLKDGACNFVTCNNNYQNLSVVCNKPWCWVCEKVKYEVNGCNDKSHNSH